MQVGGERAQREDLTLSSVRVEGVLSVSAPCGSRARVTTSNVLLWVLTCHLCQRRRGLPDGSASPWLQRPWSVDGRGVQGGAEAQHVPTLRYLSVLVERTLVNQMATSSLCRKTRCNAINIVYNGGRITRGRQSDQPANLTGIAQLCRAPRCCQGIERR